MQSLDFAQKQVEQFPQYREYFDGWVEVKIHSDVKTKLGQAFVQGELSIAKPEIRKVIGIKSRTPRMFMTVWSFINKCATSVRFEDVEILESPVTLTFVDG
jgi:hypothetical protein